MSKNQIWNHFEKVADPSKARCKECGKELSLGSDKARLQTTHGIKNHLAKCHPLINGTYLKRLGEMREEQGSKKEKVVMVPVPKVPSSIQSTVTTAMMSKTCYADDSDSAKRIDKAIMDLLIVDMLPYTIVKGEAFNRLNFADPSGTLS